MLTEAAIKSNPVRDLGIPLSMIPSRDAVDFQWYAKNNLTTEKGQPLDFDGRPYLKEIYDCVSKEIVHKKAAQVGMSGFAVNRCIWLTSHRPMTAIYILPTDGDVREFSQARFNPITEKSRIAADMEVDNVSIKRIGNSFIYFRGAWSEREALSIPSDMNVYDEMDKCKPDVVETYHERLSASSMGYRLYISTPTYPDTGIDAKWKESDRREWFVMCGKCGHEQILTLEHIHEDSDAYRCEKCKEPIDNRNGRWIAQAKSEIAGFRTSQLMCPWITPRTILTKRSKTTFKRDFFNLVLGDTYAAGTQNVSRGDILACVVDAVPMDGPTTMGVDWGNVSWFVIRKLGRIVHYGRFMGDTRTHSAQVLEMADKFKVQNLFMDFGYGDTKNRNVIDQRPKGTTWMVIYTGNGADLYPRYHKNEPKVNIDRTRSLQSRMQSFVEGKVQVQRNTDKFEDENGKEKSVQEDLIEHYTNLFEKMEKDKHGSPVVSIESKGADHLAHADNYASIPEMKALESEADVLFI